MAMLPERDGVAFVEPVFGSDRIVLIRRSLHFALSLKLPFRHPFSWRLVESQVANS